MQKYFLTIALSLPLLLSASDALLLDNQVNQAYMVKFFAGKVEQSPRYTRFCILEAHASTQVPKDYLSQIAAFSALLKPTIGTVALHEIVNDFTPHGLPQAEIFQHLNRNGLTYTAGSEGTRYYRKEPALTLHDLHLSRNTFTTIHVSVDTLEISHCPTGDIALQSLTSRVGVPHEQVVIDDRNNFSLTNRTKGK